METETAQYKWVVGKKYKGFRVSNLGSELVAECVGYEKTKYGPAPIFKIRKNEPCVGDPILPSQMDCPVTSVKYSKMRILAVICADEVE